MPEIRNFLKLVKPNFYTSIIILILERIAWWNLLIQLPIYLAQKGASGGLNLSQIDKGIVFFLWAISQNLTSLFLGYLADTKGSKKILTIANLLIIIAFIGLILAKTMIFIIISIVIMGVGSGLFKPSLQGEFSRNSENNNLTWTLYNFIVNASIFFIATPFSKYLREVSFEWVFIGSLILSLINYLPISLLSKNTTLKIKEASISIYKLMTTSINSLFSDKKLIYLLLSMSGFMFLYMQFYETLPNYIFDWIDTGNLVKQLNLSDKFTITTQIGKVVSYEWLYNINTGIVLISTIILAFIGIKSKSEKLILYGIGFITIGIILSGILYSSIFLVFGFGIYTIGEVLVNIYFPSHLSQIAPESDKSRYFGFMGFSSLIGYSFGAIGGSWLYQNYAEKSSLATRYLNENYKIISNNSYSEIKTKTGLSDNAILELLKSKYHPEYIFIVYLVVGIVTIYGLFNYMKKR